MTNEYDEQVLERIRDFFAPSGTAGAMADAHERVKSLVDIFSRITGNKVNDLYAACVHENEGKSVTLKDLWLLSDKHIMLVDSFDKAVSFRLFSARKKISSVRITAEDYEFDGDYRSSHEGSRLKLECTTSDYMLVEREAWGPYCPHLARLIRLWVLPNLE